MSTKKKQRPSKVSSKNTTKNTSPNKTGRRAVNAVQQLLVKGEWKKNLGVQLKNGLLLDIFRVILPVLGVVNVAISRPPISTPSLLASLAAVLYPLLDNFLQKRTAGAKRSFHHFIRDSGLFRTLMDILFVVDLPALLIRYPSAVSDFLKLGSSVERIQYGTEAPKVQVVDMYMPAALDEDDVRGLVFFVYGGAWGSGNPTMYRLVAKAFLEKGMAVAVVGYRTYPEGDALAQVGDLERAAAELTRKHPKLCMADSELGVCVIGHSSGAHICSLMMVERLRSQLELDCLGVDSNHGLMKISSFIGISGPYDISRHFEYEASKGLEQLSPMQAACGGKQQFERNSPTVALQKLLSQYSEEEIEALDKMLPRVALCHGAGDDVVPVQATENAAAVLRSLGVTKCDDLYFSELGHSAIIHELMFGGEVQDALVKWTEEAPKWSCSR